MIKMRARAATLRGAYQREKSVVKQPKKNETFVKSATTKPSRPTRIRQTTSTAAARIDRGNSPQGFSRCKSMIVQNKPRVINAAVLLRKIFQAKKTNPSETSAR